MKGNFFAQFKKYLMNSHESELSKFIPYYETMLQHKDQLNNFLEDVEKYHLQFYYNDYDEGGYTEGYFTVNLYTKDPYSKDGWSTSIGYLYKIELIVDDRMTGYCQCTSEDEGYNAVVQCTGQGCDWYAPSINITKVYNVTNFSFTGEQCDLWKLEEKWIDNKEDHDKEIKMKQIEYLKRQMDDIKREIEMLEN